MNGIGDEQRIQASQKNSAALRSIRKEWKCAGKVVFRIARRRKSRERFYGGNTH